MVRVCGVEAGVSHFLDVHSSNLPFPMPCHTLFISVYQCLQIEDRDSNLSDTENPSRNLKGKYRPSVVVSSLTWAYVRIYG